MGDLIYTNCDIFKKLDFDSHNQWILYDERFHNFFDYFAEFISVDVNVLSEHEVLEGEEQLQRHEFLDPTDRRSQLQLLERANPGFLKYTETQALEITLQQENNNLEVQTSSYAVLVEEMRSTKTKLHFSLSGLEERTSELLHTERDLLTACQNQARQLEELQRDNSKLCSEATKCFSKIQSPPMFVHQLPLEHYFIKCDSFNQYFTLYMKENFKIQDYLELNNDIAESQEVAAKFESLEKSIEHYTLAYIKEKAKARATQSLCDHLDITQIHVISLAEMARETHELELLNEHHLKNATETLLNDLGAHVKQLAQQRMELILYENTRQKLLRAQQRRADDTRLTQISSDALSNAELVWIAIQLDLEKKRNRFDNSGQRGIETRACLRRISAMRTLNAATIAPNSTAAGLVEQMAELLSQHLGGQRVRAEPKACLYEYEKFCRLTSYALNGMITRKAYTHTLDQLNELNRLEGILQPMVYDSPVQAPMFEHVRFLRPIFNARMQQQRVDKTLRQLRTQFQENMVEKMDNDKLWRYGQLLWVWFLTDPSRAFMAHEEVKKRAAKVPPRTGVKVSGGIKRK